MGVSRFFRRSQGEPDVEFPKRGSDVSRMDGAETGATADQAGQFALIERRFATAGTGLKELEYSIKVQGLVDVVTPTVLRQIESAIHEYDQLYGIFKLLRQHYELFDREQQAIEIRLAEIEEDVRRMQEAQVAITLDVARASAAVATSADRQRAPSPSGTARDPRYDAEHARMTASAGRRRDGLRALTEIASDPERGLPALLREQDELQGRLGVLDRSRAALTYKARAVLVTDGRAAEQLDAVVRGQVAERIRVMELGAASVAATMNRESVPVAYTDRLVEVPSLLDFRPEDLQG